MISLTDTHAHLYLEEFDADRLLVMQRAEQNGVCDIFLPNIDASSINRMLKIAGDWPHLCHPMMGLHPTSVKGNFLKELEIVEQYLADRAYTFCAIGEIGLDLYWDKSFENEQLEAFNIQLDLAIQYRLPVVIHTRNSMELALKVLKERNDSRVQGVFHCFSGNTGQAGQAVELGFSLGIGGVITYKNSGLQKVVEQMPLESLLLETDAPFLPPVPYRGQRNEPAYIPVIAAKIAGVKKISPEKVARVTTENARRLFSGRRKD